MHIQGWWKGEGGMNGESSTDIYTLLCVKSEKAMARHSSVLAWRIPGTGEPGGLPSMGSYRVGHD